VGSAISGFGMALHAQLGTWSSKISAYIALTEFTADKLGSFRIPREKIFVKPNFVEDCGLGQGDGDYALFVGRLSPEKGIQTLIDADRAGAFCMDVVVVGDGPMRAAVDEAAARPGSRLKVKGFQGHDEIIFYMKRAKVLLLTSLWYEAGLPLVAIEGISLGLPVIAAAVGNAELIGSKRIGLLYPAGDSAGLAAALREYMAHPEAAAAMRRRAREYYLVTYTPESNYDRLTYIYDRAIGTVKHTV
jgi:glycosyltransferase involved in cell wall biosynthesis